MRAISVRVNDVVGVAGFVLPGMHVDVLVTARLSGQADTFTRTVLQNIGVLSAGQTIQTDAKSQSIIAPVVTLLVTPEEAEAVTLANNEGKIQLVLRNSTDGIKAQTRGRALRDLFGGEAPAPVAAAVEAVAPAKTLPPPRHPAAARAWRPAPQEPPIMVVTAPPPQPAQMIIVMGSQQKVVAFP